MQNKIRIIIFTLLIGLMVSLTGGCGGGGSGSGDPGAGAGAGGSGSGGGSGGGGGGTAPSAPTGVRATFSSPTTATVSWDSVSDATSYNIHYSKTSGVTKQNGIKVANVTSPNEIQNLQDNTTYYFVVTAVNSYGESPESAQVSAMHTSFCQADLEGTWNVNIFRTGANPGWARGSMTLSSTGSATFNNWRGNIGCTEEPPANSPAYSVDEKGVISETGNPLYVQYHGIMGSGKNITVATATDKSSSTWKIVVSQKQVAGVTFGNADVTGPISFVFHQLEDGLTSTWVRGSGTINSSRKLTIDNIIDPSGPGTPPQANYTTLSVDSNGIVRSSNEPNFSGVMSPDKKIIVGTNTDLATGNFQLRVIQIIGQTFGAGDVPCTTNMHALIGGETHGSWQHGTVTGNSTGYSLFQTYLDSIGNTSAPRFTIAAGADGTITRPSETALQFHGTVSYGKDMAVSTYTAAQGAYGMVFSLW